MYLHIKAATLNDQFRFIFHPFHQRGVDSAAVSFISACDCCRGSVGGSQGVRKTQGKITFELHFCDSV